MSAREGARDDELLAGPRGTAPTIGSIVAGVAAGLVLAIMGVALVLSRPSEFVSQATLLIDQPRAVAASGSEGLIVKLSRLRVKYADLAVADVVVNPVAEETGVPPREVRRETYAFAPAQTLTVVAGARSGERDRAQRLADAIAEQLVAYAEDEQEALDIPEDQRVTLTLIDDASRSIRVSPSGRRATSVGVLAFVVGTLIVAVGVPLLRDRRG